MKTTDVREALKVAIDRLEDMLRGDDGQAWKEAERVLPDLRAALSHHVEHDTENHIIWKTITPGGRLDASTTAATPAQATAVPEGCVIVPKEPTKAMLRPFYECPPDELELAYEAMRMVIAAAPDQTGRE